MKPITNTINNYISKLPEKTLSVLFGYLDIPDILNIARTSIKMNSLAKDDRIWKQIAHEIGIPAKSLDTANSSSIIKLFLEIHNMDKSHCSSSSISNSITIESLKKNLNKKKCLDFKIVWEKIIEQVPSTTLSIPKEVEKIENPDILDQKFGEWIENNKAIIDKYLLHVSLGNLGLSFLPESLGYLNKLETLNLGMNELSSLPESFGDLTKLELLAINNNQLSFLPKSFGKLGKLRWLDLRHNKLSSLPESFGGLIQLELLAINNNQLSFLPKSFGELEKLRSLDLNYNKLSSLPESFGDLTKLELLVINNNQLSFLPKSFVGLTQLELLVIGNNQLSSLPESFGELEKLRVLNLEHNELSSLPESFGNLRELKWLSLGKNRFPYVPEAITGMLDKLRKFDFD